MLIHRDEENGREQDWLFLYFCLFHILFIFECFLLSFPSEFNVVLSPSCCTER